MIAKEIVVCDESLSDKALEYSHLLQLPIASAPHYDCYITLSNEGIYIHNTKLKLSYLHSFLSTKIQQRGIAQNQHLLKAFRNKQQSITTILDVTAGWCRDSFILASNGFNVTAVEQSPVVYCLNQYAVEQYLQVQSLNLTLHLSNALHFLQRLDKPFDAVYLDPMFPQHKNQAKNKKELQVLQSLTQNSDIDALFQLSLQKAGQRTVVKRPLHAEFLSNKKPDFQYLGKTIRFDVYQQFNHCC